MTPEEMRSLGSNWAAEGRLDLRDHWLMCAEICDRLDNSPAILAERERAAKVDFTEIIWGVLKEHKKSKRLALHDLHVMHVRIAAAIREPTDG